MTFFLIIDTNASYVGGCAWRIILAKKSGIIETRESKNIVADIDNMLKHNDLSLKNLEFIAINTGPCSFTALRSALTVGKTLSYVCNVPLIGYPAYRTYECYSKKVILFNAKSRGIYCFSRGKKKLFNLPADLEIACKREEELFSPDFEALKKRLAGEIAERLIICKSDVKTTYEEVLALFRGKKFSKNRAIKLLY
jgi:tRNA A37 threonylcarbamoyladenosine modification protein TsaB